MVMDSTIITCLAGILTGLAAAAFLVFQEWQRINALQQQVRDLKTTLLAISTAACKFHGMVDVVLTDHEERLAIAEGAKVWTDSEGRLRRGCD